MGRPRAASERNCGEDGRRNHMQCRKSDRVSGDEEGKICMTVCGGRQSPSDWESDGQNK